MPWCEPCQTFYNPGSVADEGTCPTCGEPLEVGDVAHQHAETLQEQAEVAKVPWHFWVGVVAVVIYLGWRVIQGFLLLF